MKKRLLFIALVLIHLNTKAQYSFEYFNDGDKNFVHLIETDDNKLGVFISDSLFLFSQEGEILETKKIHDEDYHIRSIIQYENGDFLTVGHYNYDIEGRYDLWLKKYNNNFEPLWEKTHFVDYNGKVIYWSWDCIRNYNNDILVFLTMDSLIFGGSPDSSFMYQFSESGDFIKSLEYTDYAGLLRNGKMAQMPDTSGYLLAAFNSLAGMGYGSDCIFKLNNDFEIVEMTDLFYTGNIQYHIYHDIEFVTDTRFIYTGYGYAHQPDYPDIAGITLFDTAYNEIKTQTFGFKHVWNASAYTNSLSFVDTASIFIAYLSPGLHWFPPTELNYSIVVKLNSSLAVQWEKFYGDSATMSMNLSDVFATKDGGCILAGKVQFAPFDVVDIKTFIVKLDAEGNLPESINEPKIKAHELILYPNPGNNQLNIRTAVQRIGGEFKIYDISGKLVFQEHITQNITTIDTKQLASGTYIYNYTHHGKEIESGKWVKR